MRALSFLEKLERARVEFVARRPWLLPLERLHGQVGDDGLERVTTQVALEVQQVPQRARRAGT
jgi:hypothetical protein